MTEQVNLYVFGNAEVCVGAGYRKGCKTPFISIGRIEQQEKIGVNLLNTKTFEEDKTVLLFKNLESLAILEKAIKNTKRILKEQNKLLP